MTAIQLNAEIINQVKLIKDESKLKKIFSYINRINKTKKDSTLISDEEFQKRVALVHEKYKKGEYAVLNSREEIIEFVQKLKAEAEQCTK